MKEQVEREKIYYIFKQEEEMAKFKIGKAFDIYLKENIYQSLSQNANFSHIIIQKMRGVCGLWIMR